MRNSPERIRLASFIEFKPNAMTDSYEDKNSVPVDPIALDVLGGVFTVRKVIVEPGQTKEEVVKFIHDTPTDRWFVILAESEGTTQDVLALIADDYDFQFVGLGTLEGD